MNAKKCLMAFLGVLSHAPPQHRAAPRANPLLSLFPQLQLRDEFVPFGLPALGDSWI